ncbi:geranylgeranyl pyrophosphate synthetase [Zalaria obscura]|uniref:Geranylgeranyl pyrophosphate synthetase n=1 Tax=Zalaria obscura TaxID=2024903 RepID=A0ACC3SIR0_9PEZI
MQEMVPDALPGAAIPTRTSSSNAINGHGLPRKQSLTAVPEDEWMGQARKSQALPQSQPVSPILSDPHRSLDNEAIPQMNASWSEEKEKILLGPFDYMFGHPGKDIRSQMIAAFNVWLQVPEQSLTIITKAVGMLHTASLLVDDVEDSSLLRRGVPVAHNIFGTAQTINSANYVYFCALQELLKLNNPNAIQIYTEELLNLHRGQGMDLFWRDTLTCPSEDDYLEMVGNKTGGLFRLAIKLMQAESLSTLDCVPLVNTIGLLFQILDDYKNLSDTTYTANKGLCEDLTEGKFSFPIIHSIRTDPTNLVLINILKQKTRDDEVKKYAMSYMEKTGSFSYTRKVLRGLTKKALAQVDALDDGEGKGNGVRAILERLKVDKSRQSINPAAA